MKHLPHYIFTITIMFLKKSLDKTLLFLIHLFNSYLMNTPSMPGMWHFLIAISKV